MDGFVCTLRTVSSCDAGALHAALLDVHMLTCTGTRDATVVMLRHLRFMCSGKSAATVREFHARRHTNLMLRSSCAVAQLLDATVLEVHVHWLAYLMLRYLDHMYWWT